ncbi:MAG: leucine-rich repeat domain-containing protein, partial [Firmicutes bacterium]|nr:leucine-rich repeat domain-containing protein [Bacillota bacterium]
MKKKVKAFKAVAAGVTAVTMLSGNVVVPLPVGDGTAFLAEAEAAYQTVGDFEFYVGGSGTNKYAYVYKFKGTGSTFEIPESVEYNNEVYPVTYIYSSAFSGNTTITSAVIPSFITKIEGWAFQGCTNLETVTLSSGLTSIGSSAFNGCTKLSEITVPATVTSIGSNAFQNCTSLATVTLQGGG